MKHLEREDKEMERMGGQVEGITVAKYRKGKFTWTCKVSGQFYCATFHNGRKTAVTYFSKSKNEINALIKKEIADGFKRVGGRQA